MTKMIPADPNIKLSSELKTKAYLCIPGVLKICRFQNIRRYFETDMVTYYNTIKGDFFYEVEQYKELLYIGLLVVMMS